MDRRRFLVLVVLAIVVPAGFLVTLKLTGMLDGTVVVAETLTLEPVEWEFEKSSFTTDCVLWFTPEEEWVKNTYIDNAANITLAVDPAAFLLIYPRYGGSSTFNLRLNVTASVGEGFVESVRIVLSEDYNASLVSLNGVSQGKLMPQFYEWENLTIKDWTYHGSSRLEGSQKAFIEAVGDNQPKAVFFFARGIDWALKTSENVSQQLEIKAEVTYFNGTDYVKVALPILINLVADAGDAFEDARIATSGSYIGSISTFDNPVDFYKIWLSKDQNITIMTGLRHVSVNITLFDPTETPRASAKSIKTYSYDPILMDELKYTADMDGYWYVKLQSYFDQGLYKLTITVK